MNKGIAKYTLPALLVLVSVTGLSGCVTQSFENNEPIVSTQANRDEMAATRISLGLGYLKMGNMSQAKMNLEKAKAFSPQLVQVHTAFAHYYETVGENDLAKESFEQALLLKADSADTLNNYGVFLCRQGQVEEAEVQFLKAIAVPSYLLVSESYENLSSCYLQNDDFDKAYVYLNKAIHHSPNRVSTLLQMVRLQYAMGNYKEAKRYLQKFERNTQRYTADSLALAYKVYWKLGQRRTAGNYANMLVKMYPQSWEGKQYLLNELDNIPADDLATRYQLSNKHKESELNPAGGKRIVKLSPNTSGNSIYTNSIKTESPKPNVINTQVTPYSQQSVITPTVAASTVTAAVINESEAIEGKVTSQTTTQATVPSQGRVNVVSTTATTTGVVSSVAQPVVSTSAVVLTAATATTAAVISSEPDAKTQNQVMQVTESVQSPTENVIATSEIQASEELIVSESSVNEVIQTGAIETTAVEAVVVEAEVVSEFITENYEPTSTAPVAAKRDVPLPDAIVEEVIIEETVVIAAVSATPDSATVEIVEAVEVIATQEQVLADNKVTTIDETNIAVIEQEVLTESLNTEALIAEEVESEVMAAIEVAEVTIAEENTADVTVEIEEAVTEEAMTADRVIAEDVTLEQLTVIKEPATHIVEPGQNLYNISVKYNIRLSALRKWNNISESNKIRIGEKLFVENPDTVNTINE